MPKKTKREKIIAQYRRKLSTEFTPSSIPHHVAAPVEPMDQSIRRDLFKTLVLAAVAIAGEVVLSRMMR